MPDDRDEDLPAHLRLFQGGLQPTQEQREAARIRKQEKEQQITQAIQLRAAGMTLRKIADECGFSSIDQTSRILQKALAESRAADVDSLRDLENTRLDRAQAAIWPAVLRGDYAAVDRFVRISERRSRLNGMDAPQQIQVTPGSEPIQAWVSRVLALEAGQADVVEAEVVDWGEGET